MLTKSKVYKKENLIAIIDIFATSNNTIINVSNLRNKTLFLCSSGLLGVKGSRRSSSYLGQAVSNLLGKKLLNLGTKYLYVKIRGFGKGRYSSVKGFFALGFSILSISDTTSLPFNGCKPSKRRRI
jgi:small subunit ribosomal protein S11